MARPPAIGNLVPTRHEMRARQSSQLRWDNALAEPLIQTEPHTFAMPDFDRVWLDFAA
jgi:hypothetical protein